jgi:hypothetical protein
MAGGLRVLNVSDRFRVTTRTQLNARELVIDV